MRWLKRYFQQIVLNSEHDILKLWSLEHTDSVLVQSLSWTWLKKKKSGSGHWWLTYIDVAGYRLSKVFNSLCVSEVRVFSCSQRTFSWRKCPTEAAEYKALTLCRFLQLENQFCTVFNYLLTKFSIFTDFFFCCDTCFVLMQIIFVHWSNSCRNFFSARNKVLRNKCNLKLQKLEWM